MLNIVSIGNKMVVNKEWLSKNIEKYKKARGQGWTGYKGALAEIVFRLSLQPYIDVESYYLSTTWEDLYIILPNGKRVNVEVKTGAGVLGYAQRHGKLRYEEDDRRPENVLKGVDVVFYIPKPSDCEDIDTLLDEGIALSKADFIQFLIANTGKRKHSFATATKFAKDRTEIDIQSAYLDQLHQATESGCYDSIRTYLMDNGLL